MDALIIIPARLGSSRFPGKVLHGPPGRPLVRRTYDNAAAAGEALVVTPDREVYEAVLAFGGNAAMVPADGPDTCRSGTERVAMAVTGRRRRVVINLQADEPELGPELLAELARFHRYWHRPVTTLAVGQNQHEQLNTNRVKVVVNSAGDAVYFSRSPLAGSMLHVGVYAITNKFLGCIAGGWVQRTPYAEAERLEQLDWLRCPIKVMKRPAAHHGGGIDTREDYDGYLARTAR